MEFSNPDIHSAIVEERIAELQQEASRDHLAQLAHNGQPPDESEVRVHGAGLRGRLGHRLIALGRVIEGAEEMAGDGQGQAHPPRAGTPARLERPAGCLTYPRTSGRRPTRASST